MLDRFAIPGMRGIREESDAPAGAFTDRNQPASREFCARGWDRSRAELFPKERDLMWWRRGGGGGRRDGGGGRSIQDVGSGAENVRFAIVELTEILKFHDVAIFNDIAENCSVRDGDRWFRGSLPGTLVERAGFNRLYYLQFEHLAFNSIPARAKRQTASEVALRSEKRGVVRIGAP